MARKTFSGDLAGAAVCDWCGEEYDNDELIADENDGDAYCIDCYNVAREQKINDASQVTCDYCGEETNSPAALMMTDDGMYACESCRTEHEKSGELPPPRGYEHHGPLSDEERNAPYYESFTFDKFVDSILISEHKNTEKKVISDTPQRFYAKKYREKAANRIVYGKK